MIHLQSADHLAVYGEVDISLDTFPYAGTTTSCESLYMGVPFVTLAGGCHAHSVGVSLLTVTGLNKGWIAYNETEYIDLAVNAASNVQTLSKLRQKLRAQMAGSALCDAEGFVTDLEACFVHLWERYVTETQRHQESARTKS